MVKRPNGSVGPLLRWSMERNEKVIRLPVDEQQRTLEKVQPSIKVGGP